MSQFKIAFHGSSCEIMSFSNDYIGLGADPNSPLGIFFSQNPSHAAQYADCDNGVVMVVAISDTSHKNRVEDLERYLVVTDHSYQEYKKLYTEQGKENLIIEQGLIDFFDTPHEYRLCAEFMHKKDKKDNIAYLECFEINSDDSIYIVPDCKNIEVLAMISPQDAQALGEYFYDNELSEEEKLQELIHFVKKPIETSTKIMKP